MRCLVILPGPIGELVWQEWLQSFVWISTCYNSSCKLCACLYYYLPCLPSIFLFEYRNSVYFSLWTVWTGQTTTVKSCGDKVARSRFNTPRQLLSAWIAAPFQQWTARVVNLKVGKHLVLWIQPNQFEFSFCLLNPCVCTQAHRMKSLSKHFGGSATKVFGFLKSERHLVLTTPLLRVMLLTMEKIESNTSFLHSFSAMMRLEKCLCWIWMSGEGLQDSPFWISESTQCYVPELDNWFRFRLGIQIDYLFCWFSFALVRMESCVFWSCIWGVLLNFFASWFYATWWRVLFSLGKPNRLLLLLIIFHMDADGKLCVNQGCFGVCIKT